MSVGGLHPPNPGPLGPLWDDAASFGAFLSMLMPPDRVAVSIPLVGQDTNLDVSDKSPE